MSILSIQGLGKWCLHGVITTDSMSRSSEQRQQYVSPSMASGSPVDASCNQATFCAAHMSCLSCSDFGGGNVWKKSLGTIAALALHPAAGAVPAVEQSTLLEAAGAAISSVGCDPASVMRAFTNSPTTSRICALSLCASDQARARPSSPSAGEPCSSCGKYVCRNLESKPSEVEPTWITSRAVAPSSSACVRVVSLRQMGHCVIRYS